MDKDGTVESIEPERLTVEFGGCLKDSRTFADLARNIGDSFPSFVEKLHQDESYICKTIDMLFMTQTLIIYKLQLNFHQSSIGFNLRQVKNTFNPLVFLAPLTGDTADVNYQSHISSSMNYDMESWLGEAIKKRQGKKKCVFIQGR